MTKNIKDLLPTILKQENNWKLNLLSSWHTIFGPLSAKVHLEKMQDDTLVLGVQDSCWLQELYLLSPILLKTINETLGELRIKNLRFKTIGTKKPSQPTTVVKKRILPQQKVVISHKEQQALLCIQDTQLREALKNFLIRCYQEKI